MVDNLTQCPDCKNMTPVIVTTSKLDDGVQHNFVECVHCGRRVTHSYTSKKIRSLMLRQRNTKPGKQKVKLSDTILNEMQALREEMEAKS